MALSKWFNDKSAEGLNEDLISKLDQARDYAGIPFIITSGLRTPETNKSLTGAVEDSAHLSGMAVDLRIYTTVARFKIVKALLDVGFNRIGIYDKHIHCDIDKEKPQNVIWIGTSH